MFYRWYLLIPESTLIEDVKYGVYGRERRKKKTKFIFPSENPTQTICFADKRDVQFTTLILNAILVIILSLISFHVTSLSIVARSR